MKRSTCLLLLILIACAPVASFSTAIPTAVTPTASPTIEPSPTPTPTPDARTQMFNDLQAEGINVAHLVGDADGGWGLLINGEEIPGASFDEAGTELQIKYQVKDGDQVIDKFENVPVSEVADRLSLSEDNVLSLKDADGKTILAYGPNITAEKLAGRWFTESEVIGSAEAPVIIGDRFQDHFDWIDAEKAFLTPFQEDVYYPDPEDIVKNYNEWGYVNPKNPDFQLFHPFGLLPKEELARSPFRIVNGVGA